MALTGDVAELGTSGGVILRDDAGDYYAIPRGALADFRVAELSRPFVEAFLNGQDAPSFALGAAGTTGGDDEAAAQPRSSVWTARTSRRSNDLWLITI
jgi:hypothetical protein